MRVRVRVGVRVGVRARFSGLGYRRPHVRLEAGQRWRARAEVHLGGECFVDAHLGVLRVLEQRLEARGLALQVVGAVGK